MAGQTKSQIRRLLAGADLVPQHRFGQNFLIDLNLMRKLVAAAEVDSADTVLEVGAGTGSLTEMLLDAGPRVVTVEIDHGLQAMLRERLHDQQRLTLIQGDALSGKHHINPLVLSVLAEQPPRENGAYKLVANLPYQIATPLLVDLLTVVPRFARLVCTVQREVGERLASAPRVASYGPVSVIIQSLASVRLLAIIPGTAFWPRPKIESVMLEVHPLAPASIEIDDVPGFVAFVHEGFQQRRKMLRRLFRDWDELSARAVFQRAGVSPDARPAELGPRDWRDLFREVQRRRV